MLIQDAKLDQHIQGIDAKVSLDRTTLAQHRVAAAGVAEQLDCHWENKKRVVPVERVRSAPASTLNFSVHCLHSLSALHYHANARGTSDK